MSLNLVDLPPSTSPLNRISDVYPSAGDDSARYLNMLVETSQCLNRGLDFFELLEIVICRMLEVTQTGVACLALHYDDGSYQYVGGYTVTHKALGEDDLVMPKALFNKMAADMDVLVVPDASKDQRFCRDADLNAQKLRSAVVLPILRAQKLLGVVFLGGRTPIPMPNPLAMSVVQSMAAQLSAAVDQALTQSEMTSLQESLDAQIDARTSQLSEANQWLAERIRQAEQKVAEQFEVEKKRTRLFSSLVHELRSPMQLLIGHAWVALSDNPDSLTGTQTESLNVIMKSSEYVRDLVSKILDVNKLEEGALSIQPAAIHLHPVITETIEFSRGLLQDKSVKLYCNLPERLPQVLADPIRVRQVLLNLLANACRFTDEGKITVTAAEHKGYVVVGVADTGSGIPEDKIATIFDPYVQVENARASGGTGLGLTISKQLIELHGGKMWVKSTPGAGSVFFFSLPVNSL